MKSKISKRANLVLFCFCSVSVFVIHMQQKGVYIRLFRGGYRRWIVEEFRR